MLHLRPRLLHTTLFSAIAVLSLPSLDVQASRPLSQPQEAGWRRIFEGWLSQEPPEDPRNGGSRPADGEGVCWVTPFAMPETATVWSDRPTFTWQSAEGAVTQLEIIPSDDRHPPLTYAISTENQILDTPLPTYQLTLDRALEPGVTYEWRMYRPIPSQPEAEERIPRFVRFEVMEGEERDRIATALTQLEQIQTEQGIEGEEAALQRAQFFGERQLWGEMWQALLSQPEPSEALEGAIAESLQALCLSE